MNSQPNTSRGFPIVLRSQSGKALLVLVLILPLMVFLLYRSLDLGVQIANVPNVALELKEIL